MPDECKAVVHYTSHSDRKLALPDGEDFGNWTMAILRAARECEDPEEMVAGACLAVFPRCLLGHPLQLCRRTCVGMYRTACRLNHSLVNL